MARAPTIGKPLTVLIIGGYGVFGGRTAQLLACDPRLRLLIAGRSLERAQAFCAALEPGAAREPVRFDRDGDLHAQMAALAPDLVVDATGPFQAYGADPYRVIRAAIDFGIDYLDLADGADFVRGVAAFDAEARDRGVHVLSGVSSFPVLSAAVVRRLARDLDGVDSIAAGIAPSPFAGVGLNVIRAIAGYAGKPVRLLKGGIPFTGYGMLGSRRFTIAPPGRLPLNPVLFSLVETPDLAVLPPLWPGLKDVWVGAGPVPESLHRLLQGLASLVRWRLLPSLKPLAPLFHWAINRLRWGEHRGGMFVSIRGRRGAERLWRSWHLLAEGEDGPLIPSMAVVALIHRRLRGEPPPPGARACVEDVELEDYEALFAGRAIHTGTREVSAETFAWPLYRRVLGDAWDSLPAPIRALHDLKLASAWAGKAEVQRGRGPLAWLTAHALRIPKAGADVPVRVDFSVRHGVESWRRSFAGRVFHSEQLEGRRRFDRLVVERFGPVSVGLALVREADRLRLVVRRWTVFGMPMPRFLMPHGDTWEAAEDGRFRFNVEIRSPLTGLIVAYRGWLEPA